MGWVNSFEAPPADDPDEDEEKGEIFLVFKVKILVIRFSPSDHASAYQPPAPRAAAVSQLEEEPDLEGYSNMLFHWFVSVVYSYLLFFFSAEWSGEDQDDDDTGWLINFLVFYIFIWVYSVFPLCSLASFTCKPAQRLQSATVKATSIIIFSPWFFLSLLFVMF